MTRALTDKGLPIVGHHVWTREKYEHATELGLLGPDDHVELIEGEIVQKMPQNSPHSTAVILGLEALRTALWQGTSWAWLVSVSLWGCSGFFFLLLMVVLERVP